MAPTFGWFSAASSLALDRDLAVEPLVVREVDASHPSAAEEPQDAMASDRRRQVLIDAVDRAARDRHIPGRRRARSGGQGDRLGVDAA